MMSEDLALSLSEFSGKGYVIAPAGYGKTHLIAEAVKKSKERQLILTHTYAGVDSIKNKMKALGVPSSLYKIETIASWSLKMCLSYPKSSGWKKEYPTGKEWGELYAACTFLLAKSFAERVLRSSYSGVYIDEYQDCSIRQHELVESIANILPCRLLGDPMQAIFDFADPSVSWPHHVYPNFEKLGELTTPWRWNKAGSIELGEWLSQARSELDSGGKINLNGTLPEGVSRISVDLDDFKNPKRHNLFYPFLSHNESVIAIHSGNQRSKNKTHKLAQFLRGKFTSIDEVEGKELVSFIKKLEKATESNERLLLIIQFAKKCFNSVGDALTAATKRGETAKLTKSTKYPSVLMAANLYLKEASSQNLTLLINSIRDTPITSLYRRDMLNRLIKILRIHIENPDFSLIESAQQFQRDFRHSGRPISYNKLIGTTLLVKGLEYDHAIIIEADAMNPKELYVALTRGAKSITIVSQSNHIPG